jgi:restriction system protein
MLDHQGYGGGVMISGAGACLRTLDVSAGETPIQEIRDFLVGKYESRFDVDPRAFEEVVGSVFRDLGYRAVVTNFSGDGGIDVFLMKGADTVGVQVKRYEEAIGVAFIRELAGALVQKGLTRGMFVTTSRFTRGVEPAVAELAMRGHPIELVDPERFFAALELAQFEHYDQDPTDILALSRAKSGVLTSEYRRAL